MVEREREGEKKRLREREGEGEKDRQTDKQKKHNRCACWNIMKKVYDCLHCQTNWADLCWPTKMC